MKIVLQAPATFEEDDPLYRRLNDLMRAAARAKRGDTELVFTPAAGIDIADQHELENLGGRTLNDHAVLTSGLSAARREAADALIVHCYFDPGLWAARQLLDMPVIGLAEAAMTVAAFVGRRFAVLPVSPRYVAAMEDTIDLYGRRASAIAHRPVRAIPADEGTVMRWMIEGQLERLREAVEPVAREAIADGADVLILGCGLVSVVLSEVLNVREIDGVPIITPIAAAVKTAEMLVELEAGGGPSKSQVGFWGSR